MLCFSCPKTCSNCFWLSSSYEVICSIQGDKLRQVDALLHECGLRERNHKRMKRGDKLVGTWDAWGLYSSHERFVDQLLADAEIEEFISK